MKALELFFNTNKDENINYETWCFEPDKEEANLGNLYLAGRLESKDKDFLNDLAYAVSETYYSAQKDNFRKAIEKANSKIKERGLPAGKLSFLILNLNRNQSFRIAQVGNFKALAIGRKIFDLTEELHDGNSFQNMVSGNVENRDKILVANQEVLEEAKEENIISKIQRLSRLNKIKEALKIKKASGISLIIVPGRKSFNIRKHLPSLSWFKLSSPFSGLRKTFAFMGSLPSRLNFLNILEKIKIPSFSEHRKTTILIFLLVIVIITGSFLFQLQEKKKINAINQELNSIENQIKEAEVLINKEKNQEASKILKQSLNEVNSLEETDVSIKERVDSVKKDIRDKLFTINHLEEIQDPTLIATLNIEQIVPKKIIAEPNLYVFSPHQENIYLVSEEVKKIELSHRFKGATPIQEGILFYSGVNSLVFYKDSKVTEITPGFPDSNFSFQEMSSFGSSYYLLDEKNGNILKGTFSLHNKNQDLQSWLAEQGRVKDSQSLAVDGSIWILKDNKIEKYYGGKYQQEINCDFFPELEEATKIHTESQLPYLYILEPSQNRIILLNKKGEMVKQFRSSKFDALKDFTVSESGTTIYLLNGQKIFKVSL